MAAWYQDEQEEEKRRVLCEKGALQFLGKFLCESRKRHIIRVGIFPPNCIVPVSFPIVSVKGLWQPWAYHCSAPSVVLPPTTKEVGTARIGGMRQSVSFSLILVACNLTPVRGLLRIHWPQVLNRAWHYLLCYYPAWARAGTTAHALQYSSNVCIRALRHVRLYQKPKEIQFLY